MKTGKPKGKSGKANEAPARSASRPSPPASRPELLLVGLVRRPHGLAGEVAVDVLTSFPERFEPGSQLRWSRGPEERLLTIRSTRSHGRSMLLCFDGVVSREDAGALSGGELAVAAEEAAPAPPGFYYSHEIAGWRCESSAGMFLGAARALEQSPAGPLLLLENAEGREVLVPFVWPIVLEVDRDEKRIVLDPPEGLMDL